MKDKFSNYPREKAEKADGTAIRPRKLGWKSTGWAAVGLGVLFILGFGSIVAGDVGSDPVYHGGGLLLFSIPFLVVIWMIGLAGLAKIKLKRLALLPLCFLIWSLLGFGILCAVEVWSKGSCCSNRVLRGQISDFSILWPSIFVCISIVVNVISVRSKRLINH